MVVIALIVAALALAGTVAAADERSDYRAGMTAELTSVIYRPAEDTVYLRVGNGIDWPVLVSPSAYVDGQQTVIGPAVWLQPGESRIIRTATQAKLVGVLCRYWTPGHEIIIHLGPWEIGE